MRILQLRSAIKRFHKREDVDVFEIYARGHALSYLAKFDV